MELKIDKPIPQIGKSCFYDMISNHSSFEAKANASRRYAEMMIDLFLVERIKDTINLEEFNKKILREKIKILSDYYDDDLIRSLFFIKEIGDKGSHYNLETVLSENEIKKVIEVAIGIFELILSEYFMRTRLNKTYNTARIFSTLFPSLRVHVLYKLVKLDRLDDWYDVEVFHKYILALVKNGDKDKAYRLLDTLKKKEVISKKKCDGEKQLIRQILVGMSKNMLPIPKTIEDCKRNFDKVISTLSSYEIDGNSELIKIINTLLEQVEPSEMGDYISDKIYEVNYASEVLFFQI